MVACISFHNHIWSVYTLGEQFVCWILVQILDASCTYFLLVSIWGKYDFTNSSNLILNTSPPIRWISSKFSLRLHPILRKPVHDCVEDGILSINPTLGQSKDVPTVGWLWCLTRLLYVLTNKIKGGYGPLKLHKNLPQNTNFHFPGLWVLVGCHWDIKTYYIEHTKSKSSCTERLW